jgi:Leucine-rich repeat (LRR) protein
VLDLSGNSFETLPSDHFMRLSLINLQKIYLPRCRLSHINSRAFRGLSNLVDLDLGNNVLREVPTPAFPDCGGLMRLILSGNPIPLLLRNAFQGLDSLTTLEMSGCGIEIVEKVSIFCM